MKFKIKSWMDGNILFSIETDSWKLAVEAAVKATADLSSADLRSADLRSADLRSANLSSADLRSADLRSADLSSANLSSADLSSANLSSADLSSANLSYADLSSTDLSSAKLSYANLSYADLSSADLSYAKLSYADLSYAKGYTANWFTPLRCLLDQPGKIRAYKLVTKEGAGPYNGGITYEIGKSYSVEDALKDEHEQCGKGINVATLDWCLREWKEGYKVLIVEFKAKDIACIPIATDGKFRLHRCQVIGEKDIAKDLECLKPGKKR